MSNLDFTQQMLDRRVPATPISRAMGCHPHVVSQGRAEFHRLRENRLYANGTITCMVMKMPDR